MKKNFVIILIILLILLAIAGYYIYNIRKVASLAENYNQPYETYYNQEILGSTLISIINKAMDDNEKNAIPKISNSIYYEQNEEDSIKIEVKFSDEYEAIPMEKITNQGIETFMDLYPTAVFKCTKIEYHEKTKRIKYLYFEYIKDWFYY